MISFEQQDGKFWIGFPAGCKQGYGYELLEEIDFIDEEGDGALSQA